MLEKVGKGVFLSLNYRCPKNMGFCWKMAIVTYYLNPSPSCQCMIAHLFSIGDIHYSFRQDRTMLSLKAPITLQWSLLASLGFHSIEINAMEAKLCVHMSFLACHVKVLVATGWPWLVIAADIQLASLFFSLGCINLQNLSWRFQNTPNLWRSSSCWWAQRFWRLMHPRLSNSRKTSAQILMTPSVIQCPAEELCKVAML